MSLNIDRVWSRISQLSQYRAKKIQDFILLNITYAAQLTNAQVLSNQIVVFPAGGVIVGVRASATPDTQAATLAATRPGLDLFKLSIADQQTGRAIAGTTQALASAVFGVTGDQFPAKEIIMPAQGGLLYTFTNITSSTINIFISHDTLVPAALA